ncbi:MAG: LacI family DNA-binding transcriptional regulator [Dermatophilaceae bacterium]|nr:LacI family transcriptional regulator [Intrasporangiaceae bacterium]
MADRATLTDIAHRAHVSEATVSRVLNNKPGVAEKTRAVVLATVDAMGYERPTRLRLKETVVVGLILPELTNPIFPALAQVIETLLDRSGYTPMLCTQTTGGGVHEDAYVRKLQDNGVAGIIYVSGQHADTATDPERYRTLRQEGLPIVLVNGFVEGLDVPFVSHDDVVSVHLAVRHLAELGHSEIGLAVGPERYVPVVRKTMAFHQAMRDVIGHRDTDDLVANTLFTVEAAAWLLECGVTAIVCGSDLMALGAIRAARAAGLGVPRDLSVVGFDDSLLLEFTDPPLTTVRQDVTAMGEAAVRALLEEIDGSTTRRGEHLFPPELVVRASTAPRRPQV